MLEDKNITASFDGGCFLSVRITESQFEKVNNLAKKHNLSRSDVVRLILNKVEEDKWLL